MKNRTKALVVGSIIYISAMTIGKFIFKLDINSMVVGYILGITISSIMDLINYN